MHLFLFCEVSTVNSFFVRGSVRSALFFPTVHRLQLTASLMRRTCMIQSCSPEAHLLPGDVNIDTWVLLHFYIRSAKKKRVLFITIQQTHGGHSGGRASPSSPRQLISIQLEMRE